MAFGAPGDSRDLAVQIGELQVALDALAVNPETSATAAQVRATRSTSSAHPRRPRRSGPGPARRRRSGDRPRRSSEINADLQTIDDLNDEIQRLEIAGQVNAELLDRRDSAGQEPGREDRHPHLCPGRRPARDLHRRRRGPARRHAPHAGVRAGERRGGGHRVRLDRDLPPRSARPRDRPAARSERRRRAGLERAARRRSTPSSRTTRWPMPTSRSRAGSEAARWRACSRPATASCRRSTTSCRSSPPVCAFALNAAHNDAQPRCRRRPS